MPIACLMLAALIAAIGIVGNAWAADDGMHVSYQWYRADTGEVEDYEMIDVGSRVEGGSMTAVTMPEAYGLGEGCSWRVMRNFAGGVLAGEEDLSAQAAYDEATGTVTLPARFAGEDLTMVFCLPWDHASHAEHGSFRGQARIAGQGGAGGGPVAAVAGGLAAAEAMIEAEGGQAGATGAAGAAGVAGAGVLHASALEDLVEGTTYPLSVTSGANGLESSPMVYGADSDVRGAGTVMGYPELNGRYKFYVAFDEGNCELFRLTGQVPGNQGNGGTIYGGSGTPYDYSWAADYKWCVADCVENVYNGAGMPVPLGGEGSWVRIDSVSGTTLNCSFRVECNNPNGTNAQDIMGRFGLEVPKGSISFRKSSASPQVSDGNGGYSLEGGEYGVFSSEEAARGLDGDGLLLSFTLDADGAWQSGSDFDPGTYYIRELSAPVGFELSDEVIPASVEAGQTAEAAGSDEPTAAMGFCAVKADGTTKGSTAQGNATLEGAELTFRYYDGSYSENDLPGEPTRTWVMRTGADGIASLADGDGARVSGDDFYRNAAGEPVLPLGTVSVIETKAPRGYLLGEPKLFVARIVADPQSGKAEIVPVNYSAGEAFQDNAPIIEDEPDKGAAEIAKVDSAFATADPQGDATLACAVFEVVNASEGPVVVDGRTCQPGDVVMEVTTDADGKATTGQVLPYGSYLIREKQAPHGYLTDQGWRETLTIERDGQVESVTAADDVMRGGLTLVKFSRHLDSEGPAGDASLAGAAFEIVNASQGPVSVGGATYAPGEVVMTMTTDENGTAATADRALPFGTYRVREAATSKAGYLFDEASRQWSETVVIDADGMRASLSEKPEAPSNDEARGNIALVKVDRDTGKRAGQGDATLAGARYDVLNRSARCVPSPETGEKVEPGDVVCTIVTDESGYAATDNAEVNGWAMPEDFNGKALAYGTYEVVERSPAGGYLLDTAFTATVEIRGDGQIAAIETSDPVERGRLVVGKVSRELVAYLDQGASRLAGWTFEVVNRSDSAVSVDGALFEPGQVVKVLTVEWSEGKCIADTGERCLPHGTYEIREMLTQSPRENGYLLDGESVAWAKTFTIREDGQTVDYTREADACGNQVVRGDLSLEKVESPSMRRLAGVPFKITSATTGEWHVLVTDENGMASTTSAFCEHTADTNANDAAIGEDGEVDEAMLDAEAGIWFSGSTEALAPADDSKGALPFDTYRVEELPVSANDGLDIVSFDVTVRRDALTIELGTIGDVKDIQPQISTSLSGEGGTKAVGAGKAFDLVDEVTYNNLDTKATYRLEGFVHVVEDGAAQAAVASSSVEFAPATTHGTVRVPFDAVEAPLAAGTRLVCFERLLDAEGNAIAVHEDAGDEGQTVTVVGIGTELTDAATGAHTATFDEPGAFELTDAVSYAGLLPGRQYTVSGTLMDKQTGEAVAGADGAPVRATRSFVAESAEGAVELTFAFSAPGLRGHDIVAFETLSQRGVELAVHADIDDEGQTVSVPDASTSLTDATTGSRVIPREGTVTLVDEVAYANLVPGAAYTAVARLHDRATGAPVRIGDGASGEGEPGQAVETRVEFTPATADGTVEVRLEMDAADLPEATVCTERILDATGRLAASHEDLADDGQTVTKPSIGTTLLDGDSGTHMALATGRYRLVDEIAFSGLETGKAHTVEGALFFQDTGEPVRDDAGRPVTATADFTPAQRDGTVEAAFEFACAQAAGRRVVAFESVSSGGRVYASHADIDDGGQAVDIPLIRTTLVDGASKGHAATGTGPYRLVDAVAFEGLEPGRAYTAVGTLVDGETGEPVESGGSPVSTSVEFTAASRSGSVEVPFELGADRAGFAHVAFERVYADGRLVAEHEDLADEGQTVHVARLSTTALDKATASHEAEASDEAAIVDEVRYEGLQPGLPYKLRGTLMDKETGQRAIVGGEKPVATRDFEPERASGSEKVEFALPDGEIGDRSFVVFEELYLIGENGEETLVGAHADIDDVGQTVAYRSLAAPTGPAPKALFDKTGYWLLQHWGTAALAAAIATGAGIAMRTRRMPWHGEVRGRGGHARRR